MMLVHGLVFDFPIFRYTPYFKPFDCRIPTLFNRVYCILDCAVVLLSLKLRTKILIIFLCGNMFDINKSGVGAPLY